MKIVTGGQLAEVLQVSPRAVSAWAKAGKIPCLQCGGRGRRRFVLEDVLLALRHNIHD